MAASHPRMQMVWQVNWCLVVVARKRAHRSC